MNRSRKRPIVYAVRDFPSGCGTMSDVSRFNLPEKDVEDPRTSDHLGFKQETELKYSVHDPLVVGSSSRGPESKVKGPDHRHVVAAPKREERETKRNGHGPSPREKVLDVLRHYNEVFKKLDGDKRRGTRDPFDTKNRIDIKTQEVLEQMGKVVNTKKRIGSVPGIEVGDEFQYKTELSVVGLHFKPMAGIDYMTIGENKFATSIVSSEGYGYNDKFDSDVVVYTGEGGNVIGKDKEAHDQKMLKGNLALANSLRDRCQVRVIRGEERWDRKGKRYVYDGLYLVDEYWLETGTSGKSIYKFKLSRIPGQPPLT